MIGRGVMMDPFLPSAIKWPQTGCNDQLGHFREFHDVLFRRYAEVLSGPSHLLDRMKGLWRYFSEGYHGSREIRKRIHKANTIVNYLDIIKRFFDGRPLRKGSW